MTGPGLSDPGAPVERTQLAWARTSLAVLAITAFAVRLALDDSPGRAGALAAVGVALSAALYATASLRYRSVQSALHAGRAVRPAERAVPLAAAAVVVLSVLLALPV